MSMLNWALYYASQGWAVFPLVPGTKSPFAGSHGSRDATTDPQQIRAWWTAHPDANIATRPSDAGLYCYDVDPRNGGDQSHAAWPTPPDSPLRVNSPSGGWHLYFTVPGGVRPLGAPAPGIDGKHNGYAVLPPSVHPSGGRYEWAGQVAGQVAAPPLPDCLGSVRTAGERVRAEIPGTLADVDRIRQALARLDPDDYHQWVAAMASVKHWEDTGSEQMQGVGMELVREWSAQSGKHDDGQFDDKWSTWNSARPGARTLGSLLHDAGMTAQQQALDAATVFAAAPVEQQQQLWTTSPVARFKGSLDPVEVLAELHAANRFGFVDHMQAQRYHKAVGAVVWAVGGSCQHALAVLQAAGLEDTPQLRGLIAADAQRRTTWRTVYSLTPDQQQLADQGLMAEIQVDDGALDNAFRHVLATLPAIPGMFQRSHQLARVLADGRVELHTNDSLSVVLERYLRPIKGGGDKSRPAGIPEALARRVLGNREYPGVPVLQTVTNLPVAKPDGTIISAPGLDDATGIYLQGQQLRAPRVLTDAERAATLKRVWSLFEHFPFHKPADRACYFAALLTTACRPALDTAPAFLVSASSAGTGKTKLAECLMLAADASKAAAVLSDDAEEQGKAILAILQMAPRGVLFDNVIGQIRPTGAFCVASTSSQYTARVLGSTRMSTVENRALWVLTGNNVQLVGDTVRRVLTIRLDSPENPEMRRFPFDPVEILERSASDLRLDLLDLIHSWAEAGHPFRSQVGGFASFEGWSQLVRPICRWLGMADPLDVLADMRRTDPQTEKLELMMEAWEARFGLGTDVMMRDLAGAPFAGTAAAVWAEAEAVICTYKGRHDPQRLGYWLRSVQGHKVGGKYFEGQKRGTRTAWRLVEVGK